MDGAYKLLLFLYGWTQWDFLSKPRIEDNMINKRCELCHVFACEHVSLRNIPPHGDRGTNRLLLTHEHAENVDSEDSDTTIEVSTDDSSDDDDSMAAFAGITKLTSTIPMPSSTDVTRVFIPPPPPVPSFSKPAGITTVDLKKEWVMCNLCKSNVCTIYLDDHIKVHTNTFDFGFEFKSQLNSSPTSSTSIVHIPNNTNSPIPFVNKTVKFDRKDPVLSKMETYQYRKLEQACCAATVSNNGRYSDFTIVLWEQEKPGIQNKSYAGGTYVSIKDWERFTIHMVYDSKENYYTLTCKLSKRTQYGWDTDDAVPDRICYQDEILPEIKKALLFHRISPKSAYKHFRKLVRAPFAATRDNNGKLLLTESMNCDKLNERLLKKIETSAHATMYDHYDN